jgi:hypothetical protein
MDADFTYTSANLVVGSEKILVQNGLPLFSVSVIYCNTIRVLFDDCVDKNKQAF